MLVVLGKIEVHPDDVDGAIELASKMAAATMTEPGCMQYAFGRDITQPKQIGNFSEVFAPAS
jgi:quinol monooxygenase YgiN